jgi:leucine dehydrogenase
MVATLPTNVFQGDFEHEHVQVFRDPGTGLTGVVAIHSTALGPAMGGLRIRTYSDLGAAVVDALRLARAMTLKNSSAGLDLGGGKAVLIDDGSWGRRSDRLRFVGDVIERLGGRYVTAEDVGTTPADMDVIAERTPWVAGRPVEQGGHGDPSAATARTVFGAIERAAIVGLDTDSLTGVTVGVLGAGKVGGTLVGLLSASGADVVVADVDVPRAEQVAAAAGARAVPLDGFLERELDVLAPCALGELIGVGEVAGLRCRIVAGAANNPLVDHATAVALGERGILYVPDFIANCGGIVHVGAEILGFDLTEVGRRVEASDDRIEAVLREAIETGELPIDVAVRRARARVDAAGAS